MKTTEVLAKAREVLREKGWGRKHLFDPKAYNAHRHLENLCALGAIYHAESLLTESRNNWDYRDNEATNALGQAIREEYAGKAWLRSARLDNYGLIYKFNDQVCKDVDELLHLLKRAEEIAAASE